MGELTGGRMPPAGEVAFQTLIENLEHGLYTLDREGCFTYVNDFIARSSGYPSEAFVGRSFLELIRPEDRDRVHNNFQLALSGQRVPPYELAYHTASGGEMWVEVATAPLIENGQIIGVLGLSHNIQRRKEVERALIEQEANYRTLVETLPHGVAIFRDERVVFANQALERMLGVTAEQLHERAFSEFLGAGVRDQLHDRLRRRLAGEANLPSVYPTVLKRGSGEEFEAEVFIVLTTFGGRPAIQAVVMDISERLHLEEQIRHAQKMEAMGNLAGGIAHDFNNLLTGILGTASLLRRHEAVRDAAELIEKSALQAAALTRQLLGFARKDQPLFQPTDLHQTLGDVLQLLDRTLDKGIAVERELAAADSLVDGDAGQLQQVFMNLFLNARDAMPQGGRILIETRTVEVADQVAAETAPLSPGRYLEVRVTDSGAGIPEPVRQHVFDPFFTTKPTGEGCGMGLAVAYAIVRNHSGSIRFHSKVGVGTTFAVHLPLSNRSPVTQQPEERTELAGEGTVLFVDDEEVLRQTGEVILSSLGYQVVTVSSAAAADSYFREHTGTVDLVILDLSMPGISGEECFHILRRSNPTIPVLFSSGYGLDELAGRLGHERRVFFLEKPYDVSMLSAAVAGALAAAPSGGER